MSLSADRNTPERQGDILVIPVAAGVKIYAGSLVMVDGGYAKPGAPSTTAVVAGRAEEFADNTGGAAGAISVKVKRGCFFFNNSATDPITQADLLKDCYVEDDATVAKTDGTGTLIKAGQIIAVEPNGVWVDTRK